MFGFSPFHVYFLKVPVFVSRSSALSAAVVLCSLLRSLDCGASQLVFSGNQIQHTEMYCEYLI